MACDHSVCPLDRSLVNAPGPCVLFATPGMISGGFSLEVFKQWAPSELNLVTLPGYYFMLLGNPHFCFYRHRFHYLTLNLQLYLAVV